MRKRDPNGTYRTDPYDPRLMVRVEPGEKGDWILLGREGIDNDGDGRINEDTEGYLDPNRNWGYNWAPNYIQRGAGYYPLSGTGLKAIANYLLDRPNVIVVWAFHNAGGMFLRGPSTKDEQEFPSGDLSVYDYLGDNSEMITPGYEYLVLWKDLYATYGDFTGFTSNIIGSYGFVGELFQSSSETYSLNEDLKKPGERNRDQGKEDSNHQRMQFNDHVVQGELYKPWYAFNHPLYGEIEIGGWTKMSSRLPHTFMLQDLAHRNASAVIFSAGQTPEIKMELIGKELIGKYLYQVRVRLSNEHAIPSLTYQAIKNKSHRKDILKVSGPSIHVAAGGELMDAHMNQVLYKEHKSQVQFIQIPGFGKLEYQFLISGKGSVTVDYSSEKAKDQKLEFNL